MHSSASYLHGDYLLRVLTLLELLLTLVILSLCCWIENCMIWKRGRQFATGRELVKTRALFQNLPHRVFFAFAGESYRTRKHNDFGGTAARNQFGIGRATSDSQALHCVDGVALSTHFSSNGKVFSVRGTPSPAATVTLTTINYAQQVRVVPAGRIRSE